MDPQYICEADIIMNEVNYVHSQFGDVDPCFWLSWNSLVVWDGWLTFFIVCPMMAGSYKMTPGFGVGTGGVHAVEKISQGIGIDMYGLFVLVPYIQKSKEWTANNLAIVGNAGLNSK